jgi:hypothetical protein
MSLQIGNVRVIVSVSVNGDKFVTNGCSGSVNIALSARVNVNANAKIIQFQSLHM